MLRVNSKKILPGDTFLALKGEETDGHDFIEEAIDKGAACIIASQGEYEVKTITVPDTRTYLSNYLRELHLEKFDKIKIIGVIGTAGKTTTGSILYQMLNNLNSKTAYLGTTGFYINDKRELTKETTPDIYEIYEYINRAMEEECKNIIIEVSSQAVEKRHLEGLRFDLVIYTNMITTGKTEEEIKDYLNTKIEAFKMLNKDGIAIINIDDSYHEYFILPQNKNITYGKNASNYTVSSISLNYDKTYMKINEDEIIIPFIGSKNVYNFLAAYSAVLSIGFEKSDVLNIIDKLNQIDGRYQGVKNSSSLVIIDYAFTPELVAGVIETTNEFRKGKIVILIGAGGDRRKEDRPVIGKLVTQNADHVIFTTDNPRYEDPEAIIDEMVETLDKDNYEIIVNRKDAIKQGIKILEENDILLVLGKGDEDSQIIGNDLFPFKDINEVKKYTK